MSLKTRHDEIKEIYFSLELFINFAKNFELFFKKNISLQDIYFLSLIEVLNPKIVFTIIDNSYQFSTIAQNIKNKKIKFIALQGAMRHVWQLQNYMLKKKLIKNDLNKKFNIKKVKANFRYGSGTNSKFLNIKELISLIKNYVKN